MNMKKWQNSTKIFQRIKIDFKMVRMRKIYCIKSKKYKKFIKRKPS